jgi:O-antigen/teichoic acid export membrane protein
MGAIDILNHLLNWLAPALWLAVLLPVLARLVMKKQRAGATLWQQVAVNFALNVTVLGLGLWLFGHDGKMATYIGMTLACASSQWLFFRAWRA